MSLDGKEIDPSLGMDGSGAGMPDMPGMPGMKMPAAAADPNVPQVAEFVRYGGWPELKEAMISGRLKAAMLLAPMAMDLASKQIPVKIVALGHRSGAVIMVGKDSPYQTFKDLKGKRVAIPSRFAVDHIFVRKMMQASGMVDGDVTLIEIPPPDMPAALLAGAVEAYATGEPFGAKSEMAGYARVLYMTRNEWPTYICCVLAVREELIASDRKLVQNLVDHVMSAGHWLDSSSEHRIAAARVASDKRFFNQAFDLIRWVMERPADRVTYGDLRLIRSEFDSLMQLSLEAKMFPDPIEYDTYIDESFMRNYRPVDISIK